MSAAMGLAGYKASEADDLRKAIAKKVAKDLKKHRAKFIKGASQREISADVAAAIFDEWENFARYGFNKAHAADYGMIAVQTAYLKANYPLEYMTALMSVFKHDTDRVAIYAAVIRQMYTVDHTFGQPPNFPFVYLVQTTDDGVGDPDAPRAEPQALPATIKEALLKELVDLPAELFWVDDRDEVPMDEHSTVMDGGVVMTLGNIHQQADGPVLVSASIYFAALGAGGQTYVVEQVDGIWTVVGNTGVQWMS